MQVTPESLVLPVLAVNPRGDLNVVDDVSRLQTANALALRSGYYEGLQLIQRNGEVFNIAEVVPIGPGGPLFGLRFMKPRILRTRMTLEPAGRYALQQIKDRVVQALRQRPEMWEARVDVDDVGDMETRVRTASSTEEIFSIVG